MEERRHLVELYWAGLDERADWLPVELLDRFRRLGRIACAPEHFTGYENTEAIVAYLRKPRPLTLPRTVAARAPSASGAD